MKRFFASLVLGFGLVSVALPASADTLPSFGNIQWGVHSVTIIKGMTNLGFHYEGIDLSDSYGDLKFGGTLQGQPTQIIEILNADGKLVESIVDILTPDADAFDTYHAMENALTTKYGTPTNSYATWKSPYDSSDETQYGIFAAKNGYLTLADFWFDPNNSNSAITVEMSKHATVIISYESPSFHAEVDRRSHTSAL